MATLTHRKLLATVDVWNNDLVKRWGPLRDMFPDFVNRLELRRQLQHTLAGASCEPVHIEPHRLADGGVSQHLFDIFLMLEPNSEF
jgi:hypothetical protein